MKQLASLRYCFFASPSQATGTLDVPLLRDEIKEIWEEQKHHISCLQDPPGVPLYTVIGHLEWSYRYCTVHEAQHFLSHFICTWLRLYLVQHPLVFKTRKRKALRGHFGRNKGVGGYTTINFMKRYIILVINDYWWAYLFSSVCMLLVSRTTGFLSNKELDCWGHLYIAMQCASSPTEGRLYVDFQMEACTINIFPSGHVL